MAWVSGACHFQSSKVGSWKRLQVDRERREPRNREVLSEHSHRNRKVELGALSSLAGCMGVPDPEHQFDCGDAYPWLST